MFMKEDLFYLFCNLLYGVTAVTTGGTIKVVVVLFSRLIQETISLEKIYPEVIWLNRPRWGHETLDFPIFFF
jgi:hypothetical protein